MWSCAVLVLVLFLVVVASAVPFRRGRLLLDVSLESFGRVDLGVCPGGGLVCVKVASVGGCVFGGEHIGSRGHVMVIGIVCLSYGVERGVLRCKLLLCCELEP